MTRSVHHVGITVSDLDRSLDFYARVLGGAPLGSWERSGPRIDAVTGYPGVVVRQAFVRFAEGATLVELLQYVGGSPEVTDPDHGRAGSVHVAVDVDGLDAVLDRMRAEGGTVLSAPVVAGEGPMEGCRLVYVLDPDRVRVELAESPAALARS
ncbi:VOC family protein [Streptomyces antibioticus]|uniref:VOC family protein n=1 Tax=Streptomyces antibioticus TaxID=1890 RepID=UPI00367B7B3F